MKNLFVKNVFNSVKSLLSQHYPQMAELELQRMNYISCKK